MQQTLKYFEAARLAADLLLKTQPTFEEDGNYVFTYIEPVMCNQETALKVKAFAAAAKEVKSMLNRGIAREEIGSCVSDRGKNYSGILGWSSGKDLPPFTLPS